MSLQTKIVDGRGSKQIACVTPRGQLVVSPIDFNTPIYRSFTLPGTAYNFVEPRASQQFVIDGIIFSSDKNVSSTNGAVIEIYEADAPDTLTPTEVLFTLDVGRLDKGSLNSLNVITNPGVWINGKTDDATTNVTLLGYAIDII